MYLVPTPGSASMRSDPALWVARATIEDLRSLASECREAAADHRGNQDRRSIESARALTQAANACDGLIELISRQCVSGANKHE